MRLGFISLCKMKKNRISTVIGSVVEISILIPIYNASEYLRECLDSLKNQSMRELEFILVNDGSTDDSLEIMKEYVKKDSRFRILDKKNTGYGDSMNSAIKIAKGKYIGIVEPDDFCDEEMFDILYKAAETEKADIARGNYYDFGDGGKTIHKMDLPVGDKRILEPIRDFKVFYGAPAIWSAIYKKELIEENGIRFLETPGASYQDTGFNFKTLACAKKVVYLNKPLYYYRLDNPNSSVKDARKIMAVVDEYREIERFVMGLEQRNLLVKYCQVAKFGGYHWNLLRLPRQEAKKFVVQMKKEFTKENKEGNLDKKYFPKKYWISLKLLLGLPVGLYLALFILEKFGKNAIIRNK